MAKIKKIDDELKLASQGVKTATDNFNNMSYDNFKQGSMYQGLQKSYSQQGQQAMKDTLGQVAARTGGMASSYATTAANQSYNNYMQQLEDVARAMYNDEYSKARDKVSLAQNEYDRLYGEKRDALSDQRYEDEQAYLRGRDALSDQRYNTEREEERVANDAYYGNALDYKTYQANGGTLSEQAYNSIVAAAKGKYADDHREQNRIQDSENKAIIDEKLMQMLTAEDFDWDKHDWDGDGDVDDDDKNKVDDFFDGSTYGADYWKQYWTEHKNNRDAETKTSAQNACTAAWEKGVAPTNDDLVAAGYATKNETKGTYSLTDEGRTAMMMAYAGTSYLVNSYMNKGSLTSYEQDAFNATYGDGAYDTFETFKTDVDNVSSTAALKQLGEDMKKKYGHDEDMMGYIYSILMSSPYFTTKTTTGKPTVPVQMYHG